MAAITDLVLHTPWWIAILIVLAGGGIWFSANRRQDKTLLRLSLAIVGIGLLLGILGVLFPSDREKMEKRTKQLVAAVNKNDWNALSMLLDKSTAVGTESHNVAAGRDALVEAVKATYEQWSVKSVSASSVESKQTDTLITVTMNAYADTEKAGPSLSSWQFDYQETGDSWVLEKITLIRVAGASPDEVFGGIH
ncbi:MAG: hypothetical protein M3O30_06715 [Planctomycetota bacterium]|nr:hypothetical protein [Planctomycetota bacterium]